MNIGSILLLVLVVVVPTVFVIGILKRRALATRSPVIEAEYLRLGLEVASAPIHGGPVVSGRLHGVPFVLTATFGANTTPATTVITVPNGHAAEFGISRYGSRDSSGRDLVESMFPDAASRDAVLGLFAHGFDTLESGGGSLRAIRHLEAALLPVGKLNAVIGHLAVLYAIPGQDPPPGADVLQPKSGTQSGGTAA